MAKNNYYIYQCIAEKNDGTKLERIFKVASFWNCEMLAIGLVTSCDEPDEIKNFTMWIDEDSFLVDDEEHKSYGTPYVFEELEQPNMSITINFKDGTSLKYMCRKIGEDTVKNRINRLTPVLVSLNGYSRLTRKEYYNTPWELIRTIDSYDIDERKGVENVKKHFSRLFNAYLTYYFYSLEDFEYDEEEY